MAVHAKAGDSNSGRAVQHVCQLVHVLFYNTEAPLLLHILHWHQLRQQSAAEFSTGLVWQGSAPSTQRSQNPEDWNWCPSRQLQGPGPWRGPSQKGKFSALRINGEMHGGNNLATRTAAKRQCLCWLLQCSCAQHSALTAPVHHDGIFGPSGLHHRLNRCLARFRMQKCTRTCTAAPHLHLRVNCELSEL